MGDITVHVYLYVDNIYTAVNYTWLTPIIIVQVYLLNNSRMLFIMCRY